MKRLADRDLIEHPPLAEHQTKTFHGRKYPVQVYHLEKRDSFTVMEQLSPEFTARPVDGWEALKHVARTPVININHQAQRRQLFLSHTEKHQQLTKRTDETLPEQDEPDRISTARKVAI